MKKKIYFAAVLLLLSCKKEDILNENYVQEIVADERFIEEFTNYTYQLNVTVTGYSSTDQPQLFQQHQYRLAEGVLAEDGRYFYRILRKSEFNYEVGSHSHDWIEMNGFYRYNFEDKTAEFYTDPSDSHGLVLMDFNLNENDAFLVDDCTSYSDLHFVMHEKSVVQIDELELPVLKGKLVYTSESTIESYYESIDTVEVTPFSPSPFMRDLRFIVLIDYDWSNDNFHEWQSSYCVTTIRFKRINHLRNEVEYDCVYKDEI